MQLLRVAAHGQSNVESEWEPNRLWHAQVRGPPRFNRATARQQASAARAKKKIGEYRSWSAVERAIQQYGDYLVSLDED